MEGEYWLICGLGCFPPCDSGQRLITLPFPHPLTGLTRRDGMAEELDGCHVGLGRCLGLVHDHIGDIEIQCCWTRPGNRELILTGNLSSVSREAIWNIKDLVQQSIPGISSRLGLCAEGLSLIKQGHDLHVHVENGFHPVGPSYQMGAIYLSMVSLLISQRPRGCGECHWSLLECLGCGTILHWVLPTAGLPTRDSRQGTAPTSHQRPRLPQGKSKAMGSHW